MAERIVRDNRRAFKGVWIPAEFYLDPNLSIVEMIVLTEIDSLDNEYGCVASNKHFAEFVGLSKNRASEIISSLKNKGFITIQYSFDDLGQKRRTMRLNRPTRNIEGGNRNIDRPTRNTEPPYSENRLGYSENREGYSENRDCRNTSKNTARNTSIGIQLASSAHATQSEYIQRGATATSQAADDDAGRSKPTGQALANAGATAPVAKPQRTAGQTTQQRGQMMPADPAGPNSLNDPNGMNVVFNAWADLWDWPSKAAIADLNQWVQEFGRDIVLHAIKKAATADAKRPLGYISAIMRDYHKAGYQSLADVQAADEARDAQKQQAQTQNYRGGQYNRGGRANVQETLPSWAEPEFVADGNQPSAETLQVEKDRAETAENQLNRAVKFHQQLFYGDLETIRKNLSKPDGHGYMSVDAPKLFEEYLAQQGQGA
nr:DnaD domain protein [Limosilactobacillus mucosae]